jgi:hypothetical protein
VSWSVPSDLVVSRTRCAGGGCEHKECLWWAACVLETLQSHELFVNLLATSAACGGMTLLTLADMRTAALVLLIIASVNVNIVGYLYWCGITVNAGLTVSGPGLVVAANRNVMTSLAARRCAGVSHSDHRAVSGLLVAHCAWLLDRQRQQKAASGGSA